MIDRSRPLGVIVESSFTLHYFQVDFQVDSQVDFQVDFLSLFWKLLFGLPVKWKCLWKEGILYSFHYSEKIWPLSPLYNSFHRLWFLFKEQSSALLPSLDILNYTFPFIQSSKGRKDKLLRSSWQRRLEIEVYNGLTAAAWRPNIFNYQLDGIGKCLVLRYIKIEEKTAPHRPPPSQKLIWVLLPQLQHLGSNYTWITGTL